MAQSIRVLVVEPNTLTRFGLTSLFERTPGTQVVGTAAGANQALTQARRWRPDVVVTELDLPDDDATRLCQTLSRQLPDCKIVILTDTREPARVVDALLAGASAYLLKQDDPERLIEAIQQVATGRSVLDPEVTGPVLDFMREGPGERDDPLAMLGARERQIAALIAQGKTNRQIAAELSLSPHTVKTYVRQIFQSLHLARRSQLAALSFRDARAWSTRSGVNGAAVKRTPMAS
jgi:DNA-binding NarL/FixJ family response regulator